MAKYNDYGKAAVTSAKLLKSVSKLAKRKSIMTMAEPGMYQYPLLTSNGIDPDAIMAITKAYQLTYASSVVTAYSLNPIMYLNETPELSDFVKKFHQNDGKIPVTPDGAGKALGIESFTELGDKVEVSIESATISKDYTKEELEAIAIGAWDDVRESVSMESLNDMYRPYKRTERILNEKLASFKVANEDFASSVNDVANAFSDIDKSINSNGNYTANGPLRDSFRVSYGKDGKVTSRQYKAAPERKFTNAIVRNNQLDSLEPTMLNVQVVCHGKGYKNTPVQFTQNLTLGVKVMPRVISSDLMIASMIEACKDSNAIFRFLKWTKGELKTIDWILGISKAKADVLEKSAKQEVRLLSQSKKRNKLGKKILGKSMNGEVLPSLSIVLTSYEVAKIKEACGVDLEDLKQAIKVMNRYYLLSLGIFDTEQRTMKVLFDCDADWSYTSLNTIKSASNATQDILRQNQIAQLFGRR